MNLKSIFIKSLEIPEVEVPMYRLWAFAVALFLPVYGLVVLSLDPNAIDFLWHRIILACLWIIVFLSSFRNSFIKKNLGFFVFLGNFLTTSWVIWIVHVNSYSGNYCIGLLLTLSGLGITFRRVGGLMVYYGISLIILGISFCFVEETLVDKGLLFTTVLMLFTMVVTITMGREYLNKQLSNANKSLHNKNMDLKQFTRIASHDLKSPLRSVGSFASLLEVKLGNHKDESLQSYLEQINKGVKRMNTLLTDLQSFDEVEEGGVKVEIIDVNVIVNEIIEGLEADSKYQDFEIEIKGALPQKMICNQSQIIQVFHNLIENGIKYNQQDAKKITISARDNRDHWEFQIQDNGIGISKEYHEQIFKIFQRLHTDTKYEGTGIGLAICKRIIENHRGEIDIVSSPNQGSTFSFTISKNLLQ